MRTRPSLLEQIAGGAFYEPPDRKPAKEEDFIAYAARELPPSWWRAAQRACGTICGSPSDPNRRHGWKIHLSATPANAGTVLEAALPVLLAHGTSFKFTVDRDFLMLLAEQDVAARRGRQVHHRLPARRRQFVALMEALHPATAGFEGPYILSDRRYKDNQRPLLPLRVDLAGGAAAARRDPSRRARRPRRSARPSTSATRTSRRRPGRATRFPPMPCGRGRAGHAQGRPLQDRPRRSRSATRAASSSRTTGRPAPKC